MRRFALGALSYSPERFGEMLVGDFLDALGGYNEAENDRRKMMAELIRTSTWYLWNLQVDQAHKVNSPEELWPFKWDHENDNDEGEEVSDENMREFQERQMKYLRDNL